VERRRPRTGAGAASRGQTPEQPQPVRRDSSHAESPSSAQSEVGRELEVELSGHVDNRYLSNQEVEIH
jgi:hypothetical protein